MSLPATTAAVRADDERAAVRPPPCPACGSADASPLEQLRARRQHLAYAGGDAVAARRLDQALGDAIALYRMHRCRRCGLEFADPAAAAPEGWYAELYALLDLYPAARWEYARVIEALDARDAVIDSGCGAGRFLLAARGRARATLGFDFSARSVQAARDNGVDARQLDLDGRHRGGPLPLAADHVVAFHVLEHLAQPESLFAFAGAAAAAGGRLWVAVPSDRRASRVYGESDALDAPPHHLTRWTEAALRDIGRRNGWTLVRHLYEPLPTRTAVWEATRRTPLFVRLRPRSRASQWLLRRLLAAAVWGLGRHRSAAASGFSMLACYRRDARS